MTEKEAAKHLLTYSTTMGSGQTTDAQHNEAKRLAIKALEQEPKPIEKFESAKDHVFKLAGDYKCWDNRLTRDEALELCHTLEKEPKTGHWIEHPEIETSTPEYLMFYECSECSDKQCFCKSDIHKKRFCSNCGAKMEVDQ